MLSKNALPSYKTKTDSGPAGPEEHSIFFRQLLRDVDAPTAPFGVLDMPGDGNAMEQAELQVETALAVRLRASARGFAVGAVSLCHLAWALVLARVSGREDVVFGTVLCGRMQGGPEADWGSSLFVNTLPVRVSIGEGSVLASLQRTHALLAELLRHSHASLSLAQRCSAVPAPTPLFSSLLLYRRIQSTQDAASENPQALRAEERAQYPFVVSIDDLGDGLRFTAQAPASIGAMRLCHFMHTALDSLIEALETAPATPVCTLNVLPELERHQILSEWNDTRATFPADMCIHELFEAQVRKNPDALAVVYEDNQLSYMELNRRANRLAHYLRQLGVKPDVCVAICAERGFEMIVALLAVLKAGGAYLPLDPAYPVDRLRFMLQDSAPLALLTQRHLEVHFNPAGSTLPVLHLDAAVAPWHNYPETNPSCNSIGLSPKHLAYIIYTSGSTGKPKGVLCEHRGLVNLAVAQIRDFAVEPESRVLQFASFSFDACVSEVMMTLCQGAALYLGPRNKILAGEALHEIVTRYKITHATLPPAVLACVPEQTEFESLCTLVLAGEALTDALASRWARGRRLINAYGPTESTVCATVYQCRAGRSGAPPIGRPIANTTVYILDGRKEPVPIGVVGELYIGGAGVARGYLNRAELTAEKFHLDPFATQPGARMYRTGDLGRWLPDGNIEFLGRNDFQVKIRGFRVELGEIEARLAEFPGVREAVVIAREDTPGEKRLVAYYTIADNDDAAKDLPNAENLRRYVTARLPEYMAPAAYVHLPSLPLTVNGKLDRKALPIPRGDAHASRPYEPPVGEIETALAEIWTELLRVERIGRRDNFFTLGGHSLLAVRMITRVRASFGTRIALFSFIQTPTIEYLANLLSGNAIAHMAVVNKGSAAAIPLVWVAPEPWQPRLASYLSVDQPVLSFVLSQEELAATAPDYRLQDLAACIVTKMRKLHPRPAYVLTGFCQTSLLAYECAQQLRQLGHEVPLLVMGDALLPGYLQGMSFAERSRRRFERELFYLSALRNSSPAHWKKLFRQRIGGLHAMREQRIWERTYRSSETNTKLVQELYQALIVAHLSYIPSPYQGRVLYLQSADRPQSDLWDAAGSWQGFVEDLEVFEAPGDHTSIFQEPHVRITAKRLQLALDSVVEDAACIPGLMGRAAISLQL
jgi:amino acid adenylation domain-containing protein